jgi:hypothetical protein
MYPTLFLIVVKIRQPFGYARWYWCLPARTSSAANPYIRENMSLAPPAEIKEALRTTLKKVEESLGSDADNPDVIELKHIVVQRTANLDGQAEPIPPLTNPEKASRT